MLRSLSFAPILHLSLFAIPGDRTPNLTTILITTDHYTPYPKYRSWSRPSHSLMAVCLLFALCPPYVHFMNSPMAIHLMSTTCLPHGRLMLTSWRSPLACISHSLASRCLMYFISASSPLYYPYLSSCSPHVPLMLSLMYSLLTPC